MNRNFDCRKGLVGMHGTISRVDNASVFHTFVTHRTRKFILPTLRRIFRKMEKYSVYIMYVRIINL